MTVVATSYQTLTFPFPSPNHTRKRRPHRVSLKSRQTGDAADGIPYDEVKVIAKFKSRHNYIRVMEVSRRADHPFAGSRLLLLDAPGNIHSITFPSRTLTGGTYFDVFAALPPILPPGPIALLGLGAGSAARAILRLHPAAALHAWEIDPAVVSVAREYFGLARLERDCAGRLFVHVGDALKAERRDGFAGILVDLFSRGSLLPELQQEATWRALGRRLRKGGRVMVNVGGSCVEAEEAGRDGRVLMEETLEAMSKVFGDELFVLSLGNGHDDSSVALTGELPDLQRWRNNLPRSLAGYVDTWRPFRG